MAYTIKKRKFKDYREGSDKEYYRSLRNLGYTDYESKRMVKIRKR
jgi:hypothetical protein